MHILQIKLYFDVDSSFNKASLEHINYQVFYAESIETRGLKSVFCTRNISVDEINKACDVKDEVKSVKGVKKIHYIHYDKLPIKKSYRKYNHPIAIISYKTILIAIALYLAVEAGLTGNLYNMIIVILLSIVVYFISELVLYIKKDSSI